MSGAGEMPHLIGVTGAGGMIGSHLLGYLEANFPGVRVRCLARNLPPHAMRECVEWMQGDLLSEADCREFVDGLEAVVHLAQANSPAISDRHWPGDHAANGQLTLNLLQALRERKDAAARFVYASSGGAVYGAWHEKPFAEGDPCFPLSPYGIQKLTTELYLRLAVEQNWLSATSLRISNAYGSILAPERRQGLIGVALARILQGQPVSIFGNPEVVRDYVHVDDVARAIAGALCCAEGFRVFNIGSGIGHSVSDILRLLEKVTRKEIRTVSSHFGEGAFSLMPHVILDVSKAERELGWVPEISLESGVEKIWASCGRRTD